MPANILPAYEHYEYPRQETTFSQHQAEQWSPKESNYYMFGEASFAHDDSSREISRSSRSSKVAHWQEPETQISSLGASLNVKTLETVHVRRLDTVSFLNSSGNAQILSPLSAAEKSLSPKYSLPQGTCEQ